MKGLIIKDLLNLRKYFKILLLALLWGGFLSYSNENTILLMLMVPMFISLVVIESMADDENTKWDRLALAMPITRKTIVRSKYLLLILLLIAGMIPATGLAYIILFIMDTLNMSRLWLTSYGVFAMALVFVAAAIPIIYKFGAEKSRVLSIIIVAVPTTLAIIADTIGIPLPNKEQLTLLLKVSPILLILFLIASILISQKIYSQKDI